MEHAISYFLDGGTEHDRLLAEADYCRMNAARERWLGDPIDMACDLDAEADRLEAAAGEVC